MSVAKLKDKYENPIYRRQAAFLTAFTKSLTSSKPSRIARRRKDLSISKPVKYLQLAHEPKKPPTPPPPKYVPDRIKTLVNAQDEEGRWFPRREVLEALGGYLPEPPDQMNPVRWTTALVLIFFKRHPEYWFATEEAYKLGDQYVADDRLLRTAARSLPPGFADRPGSYNHRLSRDAIIKGQWKDSEQTLLKTVGYMGFVVDEKELASVTSQPGDVFTFVEQESARPSQPRLQGQQSAGGANTASRHDRGTVESVEGSRNNAPTLQLPLRSRSAIGTAPRESTSATATTSDPLKESNEDWLRRQVGTPVKRILKPRLALKKGAPMDPEMRKFLKTQVKATTEFHDNVYNQQLSVAAERRPYYHVGEQVTVRWRRPSRWQRPRETIEWAPAEVIRMRANGRTVGVKFLDGPRETDLNVPVEHVRGQVAKDFSNFAWLQRNWERPRRRAAETAFVTKNYVQPTQPKWKSCINLNSPSGPEESYFAVQNRHRLAEDRLRVAHEMEGEILQRMLDGEDVEPDVLTSPTSHSKAVATPTSPNRADELQALMEKEKQLKKQLAKSPANASSQVDAAAALVAQQNVVSRVLAFEAHLRKLKRAVSSNSRTYDKAVIKEVKLHAFDETTALIKQARELMVELVLEVESWHMYSGHTRAYPSFPQFSPSAPGSGTPPPGIWVPSFKWNGKDLYHWLTTCLDFLTKYKPLMDCYGPEYPWRANPLALACALPARPQTPRTGMLMAKINGEDMLQASKSEMDLRKGEVEKLKEWIKVMKHTGDWWPSIDPALCNLEAESTLRIRKAEKALLGAYLSPVIGGM